jgi:ABC-type oligopeptide transport system substrate-binding subunit
MALLRRIRSQAGGESVSENPELNKKLELMKQRLAAAAMSRRNVMKAVAAAAVGTGLAVAGGNATSAAPGGAGKSLSRTQDAGEQIFYQFGLFQNPVTFDWNANLYCNAEEESFAGLLTFDADLNPVADWAETWESNDDASVWTFHIRPDNQGWSDGNPVTAEDFVWSWARQLTPETAAPYASFLFDVKYAEAFNTQTPYPVEGDPLYDTVPTADDLGVRALDAWTLEVTMEGPRGGFPQKAAYQAAVPAPRWAVEEHGEAWALGGDIPLVSNGPFKLDRWEPDVQLELSRHDGYWDAENIALDRVIAPITPSANTVLLFEEGSGDAQVDWALLSGSDYLRYLDDPDLSQMLSPYVYPGIWMLVPSNGIPPFDQLEVRKAVSHAIDRDRLVTVTNGLATPAHCMVPQGVFGYLDDPSLPEIQNFDPEAAIAALQGTEFEGGQNWPEITMWMRAQEEHYNSDVLANDIADQLNQNLGMSISIQPIPQANFSQQLYENTWQLVFIRWLYDYPDPDNGYFDMYYSRKESGKRQAWSNEQFDDLCIAGKEAPTPEERLEIYLQAEKIIQEDVGYMPLTFFLNQYVYKPFVQGVEVNSFGQQVPDGNIYVRMMTKVSTAERPE